MVQSSVGSQSQLCNHLNVQSAFPRSGLRMNPSPIVQDLSHKRLRFARIDSSVDDDSATQRFDL